MRAAFAVEAPGDSERNPAVMLRSLALVVACCLLAPAPAHAASLQPSQVAFFGPDEFTVESFDLVKKALAAYDAVLAAPAPASETFTAANDVANTALTSLQRGEAARQHPDWSTIGERVDGIIALVQHIRASGVTYHPAMGTLSPAEVKLYEAIDKRADLRGGTPEEMAAGLQRLADLAGNPAAKAMLEKYRRTEAAGVLQAAMPEFLAAVREDHVRLAQADGPGAREDGRAWERRVRALLALGAKGATRVTITDDPLSPVEATLDTILATASRPRRGRRSGGAGRTRHLLRLRRPVRARRPHGPFRRRRRDRRPDPTRSRCRRAHLRPSGLSSDARGAVDRGSGRQ